MKPPPGGGEGGLFNLEKTKVSVLQEELAYKVEKLTDKRVQLEFMQPRIGIKSELPIGKINKPSWISPHEVLQS